MTVWRASSDLGLTRPHQIVSFIIAAYMGGCDWRLAAGRQYPLIKLAYSQSLFYFSAITVSDILANLGKFLVGRARPKFLDELGAYHLKPFSIGHDFASFPSGHSATFGSLALILVVWFPRWRFVSMPVLFLFACSRVPIGAHFPTDVLAGFTLGFLASLWLARFLARRRLAFRFETDRMIPVVCYKE